MSRCHALTYQCYWTVFCVVVSRLKSIVVSVWSRAGVFLRLAGVGSHGTESQPGAFSLKASFTFSIQSLTSALPGEKQKNNRRSEKE